MYKVQWSSTYRNNSGNIFLFCCKFIQEWKERGNYSGIFWWKMLFLHVWQIRFLGISFCIINSHINNSTKYNDDLWVIFYFCIPNINALCRWCYESINVAEISDQSWSIYFCLVARIVCQWLHMTFWPCLLYKTSSNQICCYVKCCITV